MEPLSGATSVQTAVVVAAGVVTEVGLEAAAEVAAGIGEVGVEVMAGVVVALGDVPEGQRPHVEAQ